MQQKMRSRRLTVNVPLCTIQVRSISKFEILMLCPLLALLTSLKRIFILESVMIHVLTFPSHDDVTNISEVIGVSDAWFTKQISAFLDRHSGASAEVQKEEEKKFKEVGEAFTVLSDPKKKSRYDSGHDLEDDDMNMGLFIAHIHSFSCIQNSISPCIKALPRLMIQSFLLYVGFANVILFYVNLCTDNNKNTQHLINHFNPLINHMSFFASLPDLDANNIFKAFFGSPGGFSFEGNSCKATILFFDSITIPLFT